MGCDKVTLRLRVEKLQILKFCSFAANMQIDRAFHCAATFHAQIELSRELADAREAARCSSKWHAQLNNQAKQTPTKQREVYFCDGARGRETVELENGGGSMCVLDHRASRAREAMRNGVRAVRPEHRRSWCLCVARVRRPSRADGLRAAAYLQQECWEKC